MERGPRTRRPPAHGLGIVNKHAYPVDPADLEQVALVTARIVAELGPVDVLATGSVGPEMPHVRAQGFGTGDGQNEGVFCVLNEAYDDAWAYWWVWLPTTTRCSRASTK